MSADTLSSLVSLGTGGAVIAVVVIFIRFIQSRDDAYEKRNQVLASAINDLLKGIQEMQVFNAKHDATMVEAIKDMRSNVSMIQRKDRPKNDPN